MEIPIPCIKNPEMCTIKLVRVICSEKVKLSVDITVLSCSPLENKRNTLEEMQVSSISILLSVRSKEMLV